MTEDKYSDQFSPSSPVLMEPWKPDLDQSVKLSSNKSHLTSRILAGLGLGLVALSLTGCNLGGGDTSAPVNQEQAQEVTATTYTARLEQLQGAKDKLAYAQMVEAGYNQTVLQNMAKTTDPAAKEVVDIAKAATAQFDFKGNPSEQQQLTREALKAIADLKGENHGLQRYTQAAQTTLKIDEALAQNYAQAPGGIVAQLKNSAYEQGFQAALSKIKAAPDQLKEKSGYDIALMRSYAESIVLNPQAALDFAPQLKDEGMKAVLYQAAGNALYERVSSDGGVLGTQVQTAMQVLRTLLNSGK